MSNQTIGLALGGGGARGGAHIGALQVLHNSNIYPTMIAGTSAGSTIGAMYAASLDPDWMKNRFKELISDGKVAALGDHHSCRDYSRDALYTHPGGPSRFCNSSGCR